MYILLLKIFLTIVFGAGALGMGLIFGNLLFSGSLAYWSYFQIVGIILAMAVTLAGITIIIYGIWGS